MLFFLSAIYASDPFSDQTALFSNVNLVEQQAERVARNQQELRTKFQTLFQELGKANQVLKEMTSTNQELAEELEKLTAEKEKYTTWIPKLKKQMCDKSTQDLQFFFFGKRDPCKIDFSKEREQHFKSQTVVNIPDDQDLSGCDEDGQFSPPNHESSLKIGTLEDSYSQDKEEAILLEIGNANTSSLLRDLRSKWLIFHGDLLGKYTILSQEEAKREDLISQIRDVKILLEQLKLTTDRLERTYQKLLESAWLQATFCQELKTEMAYIQNDFDRVVHNYRAPIGRLLSAESETVLQKLKLDLALSQTQRDPSESYLTFRTV